MITDHSTYTYESGEQETVTLRRGTADPHGHALLRINYSDGRRADCYVNTAWLRDRLNDLGEPCRLTPDAITMNSFERTMLALWEGAERGGDFPRSGDLCIARYRVGGADRRSWSVYEERMKLSGIDWGKIRILRRKPAPSRPNELQLLTTLSSYMDEAGDEGIDAVHAFLAERGVHVAWEDGGGR